MGKDLKGKELGEGIAQRKDGKYYARFRNRFGKRESVYGVTLKEVKNKLSQAVAEDLTHKNVVRKNITLNEWYDKWMNIYKIPVIRMSSKMLYDHIYFTKIAPMLGNSRLTEITKLQITALENKLARDGLKWDTLNKVKILLVDMYDRAMEDDFVYKNPARGVKLPKNKPKNEPKALTVEDQNAFFETAAGTFYYNLFVVALYTGLRPGELFALTDSDIDFEQKTINVNKTLLYQKLDGDEGKEFHLGPPKTESSIRKVPLNDQCIAALRKQIMQRDVIKRKDIYLREKSSKRAEEFQNIVFISTLGTPLNSSLYSSAIKRIVDEINYMRDPIEQMELFSGHAFRHTFATRCFEAGIQPKTVQTYLGHASLQMTMDLYTAVLEEKKHEDIALLSKSIDVKGPDVSAYYHNENDKVIRLCV